MAQFVSNFDGGKPFQLVMNVNEVSTDTNANTSLIHVDLTINKTGTSPSWSNNTSSWATNVNGQGFGGTFTYDFRNSSSLLLWAADITVGHNDDGSKSFTASGSASASGLGNASGAVAVFLTTIPRATQPTAASGNIVEAGGNITVGLPRASSNFYHDVYLDFAGSTVAMAGGQAGDFTWTVPLSLLNGIPNTTSGSGTINAYTFNGQGSGRTLVGVKSVGITILAGAAIVPDLSSISCTEANSVVTASGVGGFVQAISQLALAIQNPVGIYGSTVTNQSISVDGQSINSGSGTTNAIQSSGTVTITGRVTDSRGRSNTKTLNINVMPYSPPKFTSLSAQRAVSTGVVNNAGTYARIDLNASVVSLKPSGTEKNTLTYTVLSRQRNVGSFVQKVNSTPSGTSYANYFLIAGYAIEQSWEIQVQVKDKFTTSVITLVMSSAAIFMHWDNTIGVGINKFRENGALDVGGDIYHRFGSLVQPVGEIIAYAGTSSPAGWLMCNGGTISRTTYADLFALIGTTYGSGDGSTTFNVPNLKGRVPVGLDTSQGEFASLGQQGGEKYHALSIDELPNHSHGIARPSSNIGAAGSAVGSEFAVNFPNGTFENKYTSSVGANSAHNNLQPYLTLNYLIKT